MKIFSKLIGLAEEILALEDDRSKGSDLRRSGAISIVAELLNDYNIPMAKQIFMRSITSKNSMEQYAALEGLEAYFNYTDDEIDDELLATLNKIIHETTEREIASTCLQIQVNAGAIDEMTAVFQLGDWKEAHER
nr:hypothetical protein [Cytophagales bacterium]